MGSHWSGAVLAFSLMCLCGCDHTPSVSATPSSSDTAATVLLSVTSDANERPQAVDMAMKLAGFSLDEGRKVVLFFNVKGATVPSSVLADDFAYQQNEPIRVQLAALIERGADVHVCPICMEALGVAESDLMPEAKVTTRPSLFANIGADTAVFTY